MLGIEVGYGHKEEGVTNALNVCEPVIWFWFSLCRKFDLALRVAALILLLQLSPFIEGAVAES